MIPVDGSFSKDYQVNFTNSLMPKIYFFAAMDCAHRTHIASKHMPKIEVEFEIFLNKDDSIEHFSYEDEGTLQLHLMLLFLFSAIFGLTVFSYY